ncbi:MAG: hypothetical protein ACREMY_32145, partial [bacterium]
VYDSTNVDLADVTDLDNDLISPNKIDPASLAPHMADWYSHRLVQNARECFDKKEYKKAESWLTEAIELEERAHGHGKGAITKCAQEFETEIQGDKTAIRHLHEIEVLLARAKAAEK